MRTARRSRRVLYWTEIFFPYTGGTEVLSGMLLDGLRRRGHEFMIVTDTGPRELAASGEHDGIPVHRLPFQAAIDRRDVVRIAEIRSRLAELGSAFAPELVHVNAVGPSLFFHLRASRSAAVPWLFDSARAARGSGDRA